MKIKTLVVVAFVLAVTSFLGDRAFAMPSDADLNTYQMTPLITSKDQPWLFGWGPFAVGTGATGDYVIDRNLENGVDMSDTAWYGGNVYFDPVDKLHLDLFLGVAHFTLGSVPVQNAGPGTKVELATDTAFAIGVGGKVDILDFTVVPDWPKMKLFGTGGYRFSSPDVDRINASFNVVSEALDVEVNEWQATLGVSQQWNDPLSFIGWKGFSVAPYVGVQYNDLDANITGSSLFPYSDGNGTNQAVQTGHRNSEDVVAVVTGMQIMSFSDKLSIDLEGRFIAETAVSVNGRIRW